ncbi:glycine-rich domain-containing protein [Mycobacterium intracellulare]|uniref:glycine-rich domain-containing protein n=1 Tax=Mycobacterium intracellulare TaxID=1767 RepID=UPI00192590E5|nr:hypothetical protein [Mycobacterium intracellulare]
MPSGNDPSQVTLGDHATYGAQLSQLTNNTQAAIEGFYKNNLQQSTPWGAASNSMFGGLNPDGKTPFPVLLLRTLLQALLGELGKFLSGARQILDGVIHGAEVTVEQVLGAFEAVGASLLNFIMGRPVSVGSISGIQQNLLTSGAFKGGSIADNKWWTIDTTTSRSGDGTGSVKVLADGTYKALRSGKTPYDRMAIGQGQTVKATIYCKHTGYVGVGDPSPIQFQLVPYAGDEQLDPVVLASYTPGTADTEWPGQELSGTYVVPEGVTAAQLRILVADSALAGAIYFDDASASQTGSIKQEWVAGLPAALQSLIDSWQLMIDTIFNAITGGIGRSLNTLEDLADALLQIPAQNIVGILGPGNIGDTIINLINQLIGGLVGAPGSGASLADIFNIGHQVSSNASQGAYSWQVLGIRDNTSMSSGFLPNGRSNFDLTASAFAADSPEIHVTQDASAIATDRVPVSQALGLISWMGYGLTDISEFYINVWKVGDLGDWELIHHSPNIIAYLSDALSTTPVFLFYDLDEPIAQVATEQYAYEFVPVGTGTHYMVGQSTGSWFPSHPTAKVSKYGYTRDNTSAPYNPPATIAKADLVGADTVPWVEVAINKGLTLADNYDPLELYFTENGTAPIPHWANYIDAIVLGGGGGGHQGGTIGFYGEGGKAGQFDAFTWARGIHFGDDDTTVTFTRGEGGPGGGVLVGHSDGTYGGDSVLRINAGTQLTGPGGAGGSQLLFGGHTLGVGPGHFEFNGVQCAGGADQRAYGGDGGGPGGGGAGGNWLSFSGGGKGAPGAAWIRFRQTAFDGEHIGGLPDLAPPTLVFDEATFSTLRVHATGPDL